MPQQIVVSARSESRRPPMVGVVKHFVGRWEERVLAADQVTQLERVEDRSSTARRRVPRCQTHVRR
jgi:hypothetical protein